MKIGKSETGRFGVLGRGRLKHYENRGLSARGARSLLEVLAVTIFGVPNWSILADSRNMHIRPLRRPPDSRNMHIQPLRRPPDSGEVSVFSRGAEHCPGRASNGRFGPPFWRLKGGVPNWSKKSDHMDPQEINFASFSRVFCCNL